MRTVGQTVGLSGKDVLAPRQNALAKRSLEHQKRSPSSPLPRLHRIVALPKTLGCVLCFLLAALKQLVVWSVSFVPPRMASADHRSIDVVALCRVVELAYCPTVTISIDLDDVDACLDQLLQGSGCLGAIWLISLWGIDAVQSDSGAIHQDDGVAVSDSIDFDALRLVWNARRPLVGHCDLT